MNNLATANNETAARSVGRVEPTQAWLGWARLCMSLVGIAGWARRGTAGRGKALQAGLGQAGHCSEGRGNAGLVGRARQVQAKQRRLRKAWLVLAGLGASAQRRQGTATRGAERCRNAGLARPGATGRRKAGQRRLGTALQGEVWTGTARLGIAGLARRGAAWRGEAGQRRQGTASHGPARLYTTHTGERDRGINCAHFFQRTTNQTHTND